MPYTWVATGSRMGTSRIRAAMPSITVPTASSRAVTNSMKVKGSVVICCSSTASCCGIFSNTMTQPKTPAAATRASTTALLTATRSSMSPMRSKRISWCAKRPTSTAVRPPTAAASVGVVIPPRMPPIMTIGTSSDGMAAPMLRSFCLRDRRSPGGYL